MSENEDSGCKKAFVVGAISLVLVVLAFLSGEKSIGIILAAVAIAVFGYGGGQVMNSPEPKHHD